jgi:hypothetical protein
MALRVNTGDENRESREVGGHPQAPGREIPAPLSHKLLSWAREEAIAQAVLGGYIAWA